MRLLRSARVRLGVALGVSSLASVGLFAVGAINNHSTEFGYLIWNLFLAWVPLGLAALLEVVLRTKSWLGWQALALTVVLVAFLPNSFYMVSDFIHIQEVQRVDLLYDVVMFSSFIFNAAVLGCMSIYLLHRELRRRVSGWGSALGIAVLLLLCSFAIYIGRELRWNTWDILTNPAGILVDVSNLLLNPKTYHHIAATMFSFFVLMSTLYSITWFGAQALYVEGMNAAPRGRSKRRRLRK